MRDVLVPLLLVCLAVGFAAARRGRLERAVPAIWRGVYWSGVASVPVVLGGAPVAEAGPAVIAGVSALATVAALSHLYARRRFPTDPSARAAFTLSAFWPNTGWLGVPLAAALLGPGAVPAAVLYATVVSGPHNMIVGGSIAAGHAARGLRARVRAIAGRNHYLPVTVVGLVWALALPHPPAGLVDAMNGLLVLSSVPAFLALGWTLARLPLRPDRDVAAALGLRLGVSPLLLLAVTPFVAIPTSFLLQAGMATGLNTILLGTQHRLPLGRIAPVVAWSTVAVLALACGWVVLAGAFGR